MEEKKFYLWFGCIYFSTILKTGRSAVVNQWNTLFWDPTWLNLSGTAKFKTWKSSKAVHLLFWPIGNLGQFKNRLPFKKSLKHILTLMLFCWCHFWGDLFVWSDQSFSCSLWFVKILLFFCNSALLLFAEKLRESVNFFCDLYVGLVLHFISSCWYWWNVYEIVVCVVLVSIWIQ